MPCLKRGDIALDKGDKTLPELQATLYLNPENRHLIDCFLLEHYYKSSWCKLEPRNTYHYHNLPDLTGYLRFALIHCSFNDNVIAMYMSIYCLQNKRPSKTSHTLECKALTNIVQALLLGLYPYNVQHGDFATRSEIAGRMREILCSDNTFVQTHDALVQLAMIEYLNNVLADFCPVEYELLVRVPTSRSIINQLCDGFRKNIICVNFDVLNDNAAILLPSIYRHLKQSQNKLCRILSSQKYPKVSSEILQKTMAMQYIPECKHLSLINTLCPMPLHELHAVEYIWNNVKIFHLPASMYEQQHQAYVDIGSSQKLQHAMTHLWLCVFCALNNKKDVLQQKSSYDVFEKTMWCQRCHHKQISINMLGCVLKIKQFSYLLCLKCLTPKIWGTPCTRCETSAIYNPTVCYICENKHVVFTKMVLNVNNLRLDPVHLCSKHAKHNIKSQSTLYDIDMLVQDSTMK